MKFALGLFLGLMITACASVITNLDFKDRIYHACYPNEVQNPIGKFCWMHCVSTTPTFLFFGKKCASWAPDVLDMADPAVHSKIRDANFLLVDSSRLTYK